MNNNMLLEVQDLKMHFSVGRKSLFKRKTATIRAVDGVSFQLFRGETLGLVGESGCGKTTTGRCIVRAYQPTSGEMLYQTKDGPVDLAGLEAQELDPYRKKVRMIFQDPYGSLNPRMTVFDIVAEPLRNFGVAHGQELVDRVSELLKQVGLRPEYLRRYPHAFSGGERQRIGIARALALSPELVIADEPVSALDVSVRAQVLNLLADLQEQMHLTYIFVAHDLSVVRYLCNRVMVMYVGRMVELAETEDLYQHPLHPYTEALMSAVPKPDPRLRSGRIILEGDVADPSDPPSGCYFHPRCRFAQERCKLEVPSLEQVLPGRWVACHRARELELQGVAGDR